MGILESAYVGTHPCSAVQVKSKVSLTGQNAIERNLPESFGFLSSLLQLLAAVKISSLIQIILCFP